MSTHPSHLLDPRFAAFLARNDFRCPGCGYKLMGLKTARCPDCAYRVDVAATLAAYRAPGVLDFIRSKFGLGINVTLNIGLLVGIQFGLPALAATEWGAGETPPIEFYGLLTIRLVWFAIMVLGSGMWTIQLISNALHGEDERRVMALGCWIAFAATVLHLAWVGLRIGFA